jgi:hypothetical protein
MAPVVKHFLSKCEALSSNPSTSKKSLNKSFRLDPENNGKPLQGFQQWLGLCFQKTAGQQARCSHL